MSPRVSWRAAFGIAGYALVTRWRYFTQDCRILWYRLRGLNDDEIETALFPKEPEP